MAKEINAIQNEYDKNLQSVGWWGDYIERMEFDDDHPNRWHFQGNISTLGNIPRDVMIRFHQRYYSANNLTAVLISKLPLETLEKAATASFSTVPNRHSTVAPVPPLVEHRHAPNHLYQVRTLQSDRIVMLTYTLPPYQGDEWAYKPLALVGRILASEGEGSLASQLKKAGLIRQIEAGVQTTPTSQSLRVVLTLTDAGYAGWSQIASGVMKYVQDLKSVDATHALFDNAKRALDLSYLYKIPSPIDEAVSLAGLMHIYPVDQLDERDQLIVLPSQERFVQTVNELRLKNLAVFLFAPDVQTDKVTDYYNAPYKTYDLKDLAWAAQPQGLPNISPYQPKPNLYLPNSERMIQTEDSKPQRIQSNQVAQTDIYRSHAYRIPRASVSLSFAGDRDSLTGSRATILNRVLEAYIPEALKEWGDDPTNADYTSEWKVAPRGFTLSLEGYSDQLERFAHEYLNRIKNMTIDPATLDRVTRTMSLDFQNATVNNAYQQAFNVAKYSAVYKKSFSVDSAPQELASVTASELSQFRDKFLSRGFVRILTVGNLEKDQALKVSKDLEDILNLQPSAHLSGLDIVKVPQGSTAYAFTRKGANSVWFANYQMGRSTPANLARTKFLSAVMSIPFFAYIRTERQFGYIAQVMDNRYVQQSSLMFLVQAPRNDAAEVQNVAHEWFKKFSTELRALPEANFNEIKASLLNELRQKPTSLAELMKQVSTPFLTEERYSIQEDTAKAVESLTLKGLADFYDQNVAGGGRHEFSILLDPDTGSHGTKPAQDQVIVKDLRDYVQKSGTL
jgi:insulysin